MYSDLHLHLWEVQFDYLWKLKVLKCLSKQNGVRVWSEIGYGILGPVWNREGVMNSQSSNKRRNFKRSFFVYVIQLFHLHLNLLSILNCLIVRVFNHLPEHIISCGLAFNRVVFSHLHNLQSISRRSCFGVISELLESLRGVFYTSLTQHQTWVSLVHIDWPFRLPLFVFSLVIPLALFLIA